MNPLKNLNLPLAGRAASRSSTASELPRWNLAYAFDTHRAIGKYLGQISRPQLLFNFVEPNSRRTSCSEVVSSDAASRCRGDQVHGHQSKGERRLLKLEPSGFTGIIHFPRQLRFPEQSRVSCTQGIHRSFGGNSRAGEFRRISRELRINSSKFGTQGPIIADLSKGIYDPIHFRWAPMDILSCISRLGSYNRYNFAETDATVSIRLRSRCVNHFGSFPSIFRWTINYQFWTIYLCNRLEDVDSNSESRIV